MHRPRLEFDMNLRLIATVIAIELLSFGLYSQKTVQPSVQVDQPFKSVFLKFNPFSIIQGQIPLTSEYRLGLEFVGNEHFSYLVFASYINKSPLFATAIQSTSSQNAKQYEFPGYRLQGQLRYYPVKFSNQKRISSIMNPSGLYVAAHSSFAMASLKLKSQNFPRQDWSNFNLVGLLGAQLLVDDIIGLDVFMGAGYKRILITDYSFQGKPTPVNVAQTVGDYYASPFKFAIGFNLVFGLF
jgi:hypothetical protein